MKKLALFLLISTMSGIIYKISSPKGEKVYYGSTTQTLAQRFNSHRSNYRLSRGYCSSSILFEEYGIDNCIVEKIEEVEIDLLRERELYWIDIDENCINKNRPYVSEDDKKERDKERDKEYYERNKEKKKEYRKKNKEKHKEYQRLYRLKKKTPLVETLSQ